MASYIAKNISVARHESSSTATRRCLRPPQESASSVKAYDNGTALASPFPGYSCRDIAEFLSVSSQSQNFWRRISNPPSLFFATLYRLDPSGEADNLEYSDVQFERDLPSTVMNLARNNHDVNFLVFLRGQSTPEWLNTVGAQFGVDPEFFRRHLDLNLSPGVSSHFSWPSPPSASSNIITLRVTTIGCRKDGYSLANGTIGRARQNAASKMKSFSKKLQSFSNNVGASYVRRFSIHDYEFCTVEQDISLCCTKSNNNWTVIAWFDSGRDLEEDSAGPWISGELSSPAQGASAISWLPVIRHSPEIASSPDRHYGQPKSDMTGREAPQSGRGLLTELYGQKFNKFLMANDSFFAVHGLFSLAAQSESQFLNLVESVLLKEISTNRVDALPSLEDLLFHKDLLESHARKINETIESIKTRGGPDWFRVNAAENPHAYEKVIEASNILLRDYIWLLKRIQELSAACDRGMHRIHTKAALEESLLATKQGGHIATLTVTSLLFLPLSFTSSFFSMNSTAFGSGSLPLALWFAISIPLFLTSTLVIFGLPKFPKWSKYWNSENQSREPFSSVLAGRKYLSLIFDSLAGMQCDSQGLELSPRFDEESCPAECAEKPIHGASTIDSAKAQNIPSTLETDHAAWKQQPMPVMPSKSSAEDSNDVKMGRSSCDFSVDTGEDTDSLFTEYEHSLLALGDEDRQAISDIATSLVSEWLHSPRDNDRSPSTLTTPTLAEQTSSSNPRDLPAADPDSTAAYRSNRRSLRQEQNPDGEESEDDDDEDGPNKRRRKRPARVTSPTPSQKLPLLACPFQKYDPYRYSELNTNEQEYRGCSSCCLKDISRLKQHLYRVHSKPDHYCLRCYVVFKDEITLSAHSRQQRLCELKEPKFEERITSAQERELKKRNPGQSVEESWYWIYKILFPHPDAPVPESPYLGSVFQEAIQSFSNFFHRQVPAMLTSRIREGLLLSDSFNVSNLVTLNHILEEAVSQVLQHVMAQNSYAVPRPDSAVGSDNPRVSPRPLSEQLPTATSPRLVSTHPNAQLAQSLTQLAQSQRQMSRPYVLSAQSNPHMNQLNDQFLQPYGQISQPFGQTVEPYGELQQPYGRTAQPNVYTTHSIGQVAHQNQPENQLNGQMMHMMNQTALGENNVPQQNLHFGTGYSNYANISSDARPNGMDFGYSPRHEGMNNSIQLISYPQYD